jgi:hypothetical protein
VGTYSINREEVVLAELAANLQSLTTVPLYDTLGKLSPHSSHSLFSPGSTLLPFRPSHSYSLTK